MHARILWIWLSIPLLGACAGRLDKSVRERGSQDLACPADSLAVEEVEAGSFNSGRFRVRGCERSRDYWANCWLLGCTSKTMEEIAEDEQRAREANARAAAARPSGESGSSGGRAPSSAPARVSMRLTNLCPSTVKLFFGKKPGFSSGRSDSIGANGITNVNGSEGEMLWIVGENGDGMSSVSFSTGLREIFITKSCTGFSASR